VTHIIIIIIIIIIITIGNVMHKHTADIDNLAVYDNES